MVVAGALLGVDPGQAQGGENALLTANIKAISAAVDAVTGFVGEDEPAGEQAADGVPVHAEGRRFGHHLVGDVVDAAGSLRDGDGRLDQAVEQDISGCVNDGQVADLGV